jgi:hypothetical protein
MYSQVSDGATLQTSRSAALLPAAGSVSSITLGTDSSIETWLNGKAIIASLTSKPGVASADTAQWQRSSVKPEITAVYLGWESKGGIERLFGMTILRLTRRGLGVPRDCRL